MVRCSLNPRRRARWGRRPWSSRATRPGRIHTTRLVADSDISPVRARRSCWITPVARISRSPRSGPQNRCAGPKIPFEPIGQLAHADTGRCSGPRAGLAGVGKDPRRALAAGNRTGPVGASLGSGWTPKVHPTARSSAQRHRGVPRGRSWKAPAKSGLSKAFQPHRGDQAGRAGSTSRANGQPRRRSSRDRQPWHSGGEMAQRPSFTAAVGSLSPDVEEPTNASLDLRRPDGNPGRDTRGTARWLERFRTTCDPVVGFPPPSESARRSIRRTPSSCCVIVGSRGTGALRNRSTHCIAAVKLVQADSSCASTASGSRSKVPALPEPGIAST